MAGGRSAGCGGVDAGVDAGDNTIRAVRVMLLDGALIRFLLYFSRPDYADAINFDRKCMESMSNFRTLSIFIHILCQT